MDLFNNLIFISGWIWFNVIRDTILLFEQFFYVVLLSGLLPGTIWLADWMINLN